MKRPGGFEVYFDFDNTISEFDVLDDLIARFSIDEKWKEAEAEWQAGKIGSRQCLERQMAGVRIAPEKLQEYLEGIHIDPSFSRIVEMLKNRGIEVAILSDSFVPMIERVLRNHRVGGIPIYANEFRVEGDRLIVSFPYFNAICSVSGNCKCSHLFRRNRPEGTKKVYIGDGRSDVCPAAFCEILFAKNGLLRHYASSRPDCIPFETLGTVHSHLETLLS